MKKIKVLLADDHTIVRQSISRMLNADKEIRVIEEAADGFEAIEKVKKVLPDVVVMDLKMPEINGFEATRIMKHEWPYIGIIILSMYGDNRHIGEAVRAGANSYLLKENSSNELVKCIKSVFQGEEFLVAPVARKILNSYMGAEHGNKCKALTLREKDILILLAKGINNAQIAEALYISENTVRNHISNIYDKLECHNRAQVISKAVKQGLVDLATDI